MTPFSLPGIDHRYRNTRERMVKIIDELKIGTPLSKIADRIHCPRPTLYKTMTYLRKDLGCDTNEQLMYEVGRLEAFRTVHKQR